MLVGNVVDKLLDKNGLTNSRTSEKAYLTALKVRSDKVYYLDTCFKHLACSLLLLIGGRLTVDSPPFLCLRGRLIINRLAKQVKYSAKCSSAHRNSDARAGIYCLCTSCKPVGRCHSDTSYNVIAYMLRYLNNKLCAVIVDLDSVQKLRKTVLFKSDINYRADYLNYLSHVFFTHWFHTLLSNLLISK